MKYLRSILFILGVLQPSSAIYAQNNTTLESEKLNMDAIYDRPLSTIGTSNLSIGGYIESHWQHYSTEGVSEEGHQFLLPRMTLFISSAISERIKFMSEIEIEDGGSSLAIEFAAVDFEFHPLLNIRGGIIMNPIGAFNQNHDGPKWEFAERPVAMNQMLPATWSTVGFGTYGKYAKNLWSFGYEAYLSGGFDGAIIDNTTGKTYLPASKENVERWDKMASGQPTFTGKIAIKHRKVGEIGLSYLGGIYNDMFLDGEEIDIKRNLRIAAIDAQTELPWGTKLTGEVAHIWVQTPEYYSPEYGNQQIGAFVDIVHPIYQGSILGWENAIINIAVRGEYVDWNKGVMTEFAHTKKGDEMWSITPGISFRPGPRTVIRWSYKYREDRDFLRNPAEKTAGFTFGFSTYF